MNLKRIIKEEIDDSLDWIKDTPEVSIGGKNGLPIESVPLGTKVVTPVGDVFTIEDITGFHMPHQFVWGSDLEKPWLGPKNDDNKDWYNALWIRRATPEDLNESEELDWIQDSQPTKKDIISFNNTKYETTLDYDDIEIGDKFIPPGSHIVWTVDDMYEWGVSSRDYRFMVWLKNDKGSIRRKVYNRGNKFPGDYRPWRKIVNEKIKESIGEWDWAKDITPVELENPEDWVGRSFGYGPEIIDEMSDMELQDGDDKEYYTIDGIDFRGNLPLTRFHPNKAPNRESTTSVNSLRYHISNGRWVWK